MPAYDISKTADLGRLFTTEGEARDEAWVESFYQTVPDASLAAFEPQVYVGPDTFSYFHLAMPDPGPLTPFCISSLIDDALEGGFGAVIFGDTSRSTNPEWVFTYGNLLSYKLTGKFDSGDPVVAEGESRGSVLVASPDETLLPTPARKALAEFMREKYQIPVPKVALVRAPGLPEVSLMFNVSLSDYGGQQEKLDAAIHYLGWYLPSNYAVLPLPPEWDGSKLSDLV
jgi:hypothetical protein